jgi:hypothetical protein
MNTHNVGRDGRRGFVVWWHRLRNRQEMRYRGRMKGVCTMKINNSKGVSL